MKNCCRAGPKTKKCIRKSDKKQFTFPRRFSKKQCLSQKIKGFTMRSSCAPYKDCKRQRGGRMPPSGIDNTPQNERAMESNDDMANVSMNDAVLYEDTETSNDLEGLSILDRNIDEEDSGILDISQISEDQDDVNDISFGELDDFETEEQTGGKQKNKSRIHKMKGRKSRKTLKGGGRKTTCVKQTLKKYTTRKSHPYPANKCKTKKRKGNDGKFYISKAKGGTYKWVPFAGHAK